MERLVWLWTTPLLMLFSPVASTVACQAVAGRSLTGIKDRMPRRRQPIRAALGHTCCGCRPPGPCSLRSSCATAALQLLSLAFNLLHAPSSQAQSQRGSHQAATAGEREAGRHRCRYTREASARTARARTARARLPC